MSDRHWWESLLHRLAFVGCLLLAFCLGDAAPTEPQVGLAPGLETCELVLHVDSERDTSSQSVANVIVFGERGLGEALIEYVKLDTSAIVLGESMTFSLPVGHYQLVLRAPGHARKTQRIQLLGDAVHRVRLEPAKKLQVKVLVAQGDALAPLEGATVLLGEPDQTPWGARTDARGEVFFGDVPEGSSRVRILAPGYESFEAVTEQDLVVRLRAASVLRVRVERESRPVPGAKVYIAGIQLWPTRAVVTGEQGWVDISGLAPGHYSLFAQTESWVSDVERRAEVRAEAGITEVLLRLHAGKPLLLRVVAEHDERPVVGARVSFRSSLLGQFAEHGLTNGLGEVTLGPFAERVGWVRARAPGFVPAAHEVELDELAPGPLVLRLREAAVVRGRVVDERGFPVPGASVEALGIGMEGEPIAVTYQSESVTDAHFDWAREMGQQGVLLPAGELGVLLGPVPPIPLGELSAPEGALFTSNAQGHFTIVDVPPGELLVLAHHAAYMDGKSPVLHVTSGQSVTTEVVLRAGRPVRGRVLDHREFPVSEARVTVSGRGFSRRVTAQKDGTFELAAAPLEVVLRVSSPENPLQVVLARTVSSAERDEEIRIVLPQPRQDAELIVVDERDEPIELAQVKVTSLDREVPLSLTRFSQQSGAVTLPEAEGLKVRLRVDAVGYEPTQRETTLQARTRLVLRRSYRALGRVLGVRGRLPATGARVMLRSNGSSRHAVAQDDGSYTLLDVPRGPARLSAEHQEYGKASISVSVQPGIDGRPAELPDLVLEPTLTVQGVVEDERGQPVAGAWLATARLSAFLSPAGSSQLLGRSERDGSFSVNVERGEALHLFAATPARGFGWSESAISSLQDRVDDVVVVVDHRDEISPHEMATVLVTLELRGSALIVYAVASPSRAEEDGLRMEDELLRVDGQRVRRTSEARELLSGVAGSEVRVTVRRAGAEKEIATTREPFLRQ